MNNTQEKPLVHFTMKQKIEEDLGAWFGFLFFFSYFNKTDRQIDWFQLRLL